MSQQVKVSRSIDFHNQGSGVAIQRIDADDSANVIYWRPTTTDTGALYIGDGTTDMDFKVFLGSTSNYVLFDVGSTQFKIGGTGIGFQMGTPTYSAAGCADGAGISLAKGYSASASNRFSALEIVADTGSTDIAGDTYEAAIHGKLNIGTAQTNASLISGLFSMDVADEADLSGGNYFALRGHLDFWDDCDTSGTTHVGALSAYVENESTTTVGSGTYLYGLDIYQVGAPTVNGSNPAINIRANSTAANWQYGLYGAADNGINLTCVNDGVRVTSTTLNATAGRIGYFSGSIDTGNLGDGYGAFEIDVTATGTIAGMVAASSSWLNITGTGAAGANLVAAQSNGIYADSGGNTSSTVIFGMRCSGILTDGPTVFAPFSLNTSNRAITALFHTASGPAIGLNNTVASTSTDCVGSVPLFCDVDGSDVRYVHVYSTVS